MAIGIFQLIKEGSYSGNLTVLYCMLRLICRGGWDSEGVTVMRNDINSSTVTCRSYHLASFVVLAGPPEDQEVRLRSVKC